MKNYKILVFSLLFSSLLNAADSPIELPSSVPLDVYKIQENQIGIGYIQFGVELELEDIYYKDKIGDIQYDSKGIIITNKGKGYNKYLGDMFELSYTIGYINGKIKDKSFIKDGNAYNNDYDKSGFYIGFRPSYNTNLFSKNKFVLKYSTTIHSFFYRLNGKFLVDNGTDVYKYDETNYGLAFKPTTVMQVSYYPIKNLALTAFGGLSTFIAIDWNFYDGKEKNNVDDSDDEVNLLISGINTIFGYDISYRFTDKSVVNLSSVISKRETDSVSETVFRYIYTF